MDPQPKNQSPRSSPALWAVVSNDLCIRRCTAQPNNITPLTYLMNSFLIIFFIYLSVVLVIFVLELRNIRGHDVRKPVFWVADKSSLKPVSSASQASMKIEVWLVASLDTCMTSKKQIKKLLMRLCGCAG